MTNLLLLLLLGWLAFGFLKMSSLLLYRKTLTASMWNSCKLICTPETYTRIIRECIYHTLWLIILLYDFLYGQTQKCYFLPRVASENLYIYVCAPRAIESPIWMFFLLIYWLDIFLLKITSSDENVLIGIFYFIFRLMLAYPSNAAHSRWLMVRWWCARERWNSESQPRSLHEASNRCFAEYFFSWFLFYPLRRVQYTHTKTHTPAFHKIFKIFGSGFVCVPCAHKYAI